MHAVQRLEIVMHRRPDVEHNLSPRRGLLFGEVACHIVKDVSPTDLQVERRKAGEIVVDGRQRLSAKAVIRIKPLAKTQRHPTLHQIIPVVAMQARAPVTDIRPWAKTDTKSRL